MRKLKYQEKNLRKSDKGWEEKGLSLVIFEQFHYNSCIMWSISGIDLFEKVKCQTLSGEELWRQQKKKKQ